MNRLGNIIYYVQDVVKTIAFFEKSFFGIPNHLLTHRDNAHSWRRAAQPSVLHR